VTPEGSERTRECTCFIPRSDIYENDDQLVIVMDIPGVDEGSIDVTVERDILTVNAYVKPAAMEGYEMIYSEYETGDYQRSFKLSGEIDRNKIEAAAKDGVLRLYLPKSAEYQTRKIGVKAT